MSVKITMATALRCATMNLVIISVLANLDITFWMMSILVMVSLLYQFCLKPYECSTCGSCLQILMNVKMIRKITVI